MDMLAEAILLRDQSSRTITNLRTLNDAVPYEFGVERDLHTRAGNTILTAALTAIALFWNQLAVLDREDDRDFLTEPELIRMRQQLAEHLDMLATAIASKTPSPVFATGTLVDSTILKSPRYGEYASNAITRFRELEEILANLGTSI
jgi:multidrug resistance protein MdtO